MSHVDESCHTWTSHTTRERVMPRVDESYHVWRSHATCKLVMQHVNESYHVWRSHFTRERVMPHVNESCHTWASHVSQASVRRAGWKKWNGRAVERGKPTAARSKLDFRGGGGLIALRYAGDVTHSCVTWLIDTWHEIFIMRHDSFICDMTHYLWMSQPTLLCRWRDSSMCDVTPSYTTWYLDMEWLRLVGSLKL